MYVGRERRKGERERERERWIVSQKKSENGYK